LNDFQKTIFASLWDYKQAGILDPNNDNDEYLLSQLFRLSIIQKEKIRFDPKDNKFLLNKNQNNSKSSIERKSQNVKNLELILEVESFAKTFKDIASLENGLVEFKKFHSLKGSNKFLLGSGNRNSKILFVSEPPSYEEELQQQPYVEEAAKLFEKIIEAMGLIPLNKSNCNIFVIPAVPFRIVKTSDDKISDLELIKPFLKRYIEIISPKYMIFVSKMPANILGLTDFLKFDNKEGSLADYLGIPTIEIESIKSMINNPEQKRKTWNSLKLIIQLMQNENE
tara:strand:- start:29 stop:874 length:846 start_codon:yes stop_codon:yes gene_type:complete